MYNSRLNEASPTVSFKLPWDRNTFQGWVLSIIIVGVAMVIFDQLAILDQPKRRTIRTLPPYIAINIGNGDGSGVSKGNFTKEGRKTKGKTPQTNLHDAEIAVSGKKSNKAKTVDPNKATNLIVKKNVDSEGKTEKKGNSRTSVGEEKIEKDLFASGLGEKGKGRGAGEGFGDIEWGGGGNRRVLKKEIPEFPDGVKSSSQIILQFRVLADGTVSSVIPLQKADPAIEKEAIRALKKWKFSPLTDGKTEIQTGRIPLTFVLR